MHFVCEPAKCFTTFILQAFDYIATVSFGYILHCVCFNLYCGGFILFGNVCVCVCVLVICILYAD